MKSRSVAPLLWSLWLVWASIVPHAGAQIRAGEIFGRVTDGSGTALAGVSVALKSPERIEPRTTMTGPGGVYRFPKTATGAYVLTFERPGFTHLVREGVRVTTGFSAEVDVALEVSPFQETIVVPGESPMVDGASTASAATFGEQHLRTLPSGRNLFALLEQTPGVVLRRPDVGGAEVGTFQLFDGRGTQHVNGYGNTTWSLDGATVTNMTDRDVGFSTVQFDYGALREVRIQTGGHDASIQTAGINLNIITRRGGDELRGSASVLVSDEALQADNITQELRDQGAGAGAPLVDTREAGFDLGGPIRKSRLWLWGAFRSQDAGVGILGFLVPGAIDPQDPDNLVTRRNTLETWSGKLTGQWNSAQTTVFSFHADDRQRGPLGAGPTTALEATVRSTGEAAAYRISHQWIAGERFLLELSASYIDSTSQVDLHDPELADVQLAHDVATGYRWRSGSRSGPFDQLTTDLEAKGSYFLAGLFDGDHSAKLGLRYRSTPYTDGRHRGGNATARFSSGVPIEANLHRDGFQRAGLEGWGAYLHDTYRRRRLTLSLGVRADYQDDAALPSVVPANPIIPALLPEVRFAGADSGVTFFDVSPRLGVTWDLSGSGRTILKASAARYFGQGVYTAKFINPVTQTALRFPWNDANGDSFVQREELDLSRLLSFSSNYDPADPASPTAAQTADPDLKNDRTDELTLGIDHEIAPDLAVRANLIWRRYDRFAWSRVVGISSADFLPVTFSAECGNDSCDQPTYTGVYYELPFTRPAATVRTNRDFHRDYRGLEVMASRRFSGRWMLDASFTYNDVQANYPSEDSFVDPTNIPLLDGEQSTNFNSRWQLKLTGMVALPAGVSVGALVNARDGFPFIPVIRSPSRNGALGRIDVMVEPFATRRYSDLATLDLRAEKRFRVGGVDIGVSVEVFNLTNADTVLRRNTRQDVPTANDVLEIMAPRVARFGVRVQL